MSLHRPLGQVLVLCFLIASSPTFGTIPWNSYFQRVLSVKSSRQAQILSIGAGCFALVLVIPSVLIGAAGKAADWNTTDLGVSPMETDKGNMVLPYVLYEFTPRAVSVLGLGAISAAVMSSMDSSILGSSSMFTYNIYKRIFRTKASDIELLWIQRFVIFVVGATATVISIFVPVIYGLFILAADIVFVIVLPPLTCALFFKFSNTYGALCGYIVGCVCRVGAGEYYLKFDGFIQYPWYSTEVGQTFPFRTFAMLLSLITILLVSLLTNIIFDKNILPEYCDLLGIRKRSKNTYPVTSQDPNNATDTSHDSSAYHQEVDLSQEKVKPEIDKETRI